MNSLWSPLRQHTLFHPSTALLEHPGILLPDYRGERHDTLNPAVPFSLSPLHFSTGGGRLPSLAEEAAPDDHSADIERRLTALRDSHGFSLITDSELLLKACQLDMDFPQDRHAHVREQLTTLLARKTGKRLNPDDLHIAFNTQDSPAADDDGVEQYSLRLSLTEVALISFDPPRFLALHRSRDRASADLSLTDEVPSLTAAQTLAWILETPWSTDYSAVFAAFWHRHRATYRLLSCVSLLDQLAHQHAMGHISRSGYSLTLDALGLRQFPSDIQALTPSLRGAMSEVRMLSINGQPVPGIFQVSSKATAHCFIHVLSVSGPVVEYISDEPGYMAERLLATLNASGLYGHVLMDLEQGKRPVIDSMLIEGDVFSELTETQERMTYALIETDTCDSTDLLRPLARSLELASAVDLWPAQSTVLDCLPEPSGEAVQIMADYLRVHHGLALDPEQVFIAYQSGTVITPQGGLRTPSLHVHTPDEMPISLSEALVSHYRVERPVGYVDHEGATVVFLDPTGQGDIGQGQPLRLDPQAIEDYIKTFDFLSWMTRKLDDFWVQQQTAIEQALRSTFIVQALTSLKRGRMTRSGFDLIVQAMTSVEPVRWLALGFFVQGSLLNGMEHQYTGLLVIERPGELKLLYQAGHPDAFVECRNDTELNQHLKHATADPKWREAVMRYVPAHHHKRLDYLLRLWSGTQSPQPPVSILRPWTDALYNPDTRQALHHSLCEKRLEGSPFGFLSQLLKHNAQSDVEDRIVTRAQVSLADWTDRLTRLQWVLAPLSLLLTPAFIASLAIEVGLTSLSIAVARLPGSRYAEKNQALLSGLTLGLLQLGPNTPRLLGSLRRIITPAAKAAPTAAGTLEALKGWPAARSHMMVARQTRLETFFHTDALLKRWTLVGPASIGHLPVHAWKLGRRFLLWTSDRGQARTLVVSTHGYYLPWTSTVEIPNGTEIHTYAPHGYELVDPKLHRVVSEHVNAFAISNALENRLVQPSNLAPQVITDKLMAGTALPGSLKNYTLSKFQTAADESYQDIANVVRNSNASPLRGWLPPTPMDVLSIRNRFGMTPPSLADLFDTLSAQGIHYDRILLVHCRCAAISSMLRRAPVYHAASVRPVISNATEPG